jgi:hypothetical protein
VKSEPPLSFCLDQAAKLAGQDVPAVCPAALFRLLRRMAQSKLKRLARARDEWLMVPGQFI